MLMFSVHLSAKRHASMPFSSFLKPRKCDNLQQLFWQSFKVNKKKKIIETKFSPSRIING